MKRVKQLSPGEAKAALYLDFEGEGLIDGTPQPPALAGYECHRTFEFCILDPTLALFARGVRQTPWTRSVQPLAPFIEFLFQKAEAEDRHICFYSEHEQAVITQFTSPALAKAFGARAVNAKLMIQRWQRAKRGKRAEDGKLSTYATLEKLDASPTPRGGVGEALRKLRKGAEGQTRLRRIKPSLRSLWDELLLYNHSDVTTLRRLTVRAANYLATVSRSP